MINKFLFVRLTMLLLLLCSTAMMYAATTSTVTFTAPSPNGPQLGLENGVATNPIVSTDGNVTWSLETTGNITEGNYRTSTTSGGPGIRLVIPQGSSSITIKTPSLEGYFIQSVTIKCGCSSNNNFTTTIGATVDNQSFGNTETLSGTTSYSYSFSGLQIAGEVAININFNKTTTQIRSFYIHQIIVTYSDLPKEYTLYGVRGDFLSGMWWQEIGYAGLGNQNEVLAVGEYTATAGEKPTIGFTLLGGQAWEGAPGQSYKDYISRVCIYARKYDDNIFRANQANISATFARIFDYRDPLANNLNSADEHDTQLIAETTDLESAEQLLTSRVALDAGNYVFYITADIKQNVDILPLIQGQSKHYTQIGANITRMGNAHLANRLMHSSRLTDMNQYGSRVLVPLRKVIYMPGDYYSKYYRIPCITTAGDGALVCISDARKYHPHDVANDIDMLARRSINNGITWSDPVTIAKGTGGYEGMSKDVCPNANGYGDASICPLPNGDLICCMISGAGLVSNSTTHYTRNYYTISHDNGQTWGELKEIPVDLTYYSRGCIAPGNMCLVKQGLLAGKVLACFRHASNYNPGRTNAASSALNAEHVNIILIYDPDTDTWSRAYNDTNNRYYIPSTSNMDDEAHLVEVGENNFIMSVRNTGGNHRQFYRINIVSQSSTGIIHYTKANLGNGRGMTLGPNANGDMMAYKGYLNDEVEDVLLHSVPSTVTQVGKADTRSGLAVFSVDRNTAATSNTFTWQPRFNISDPFGALNSMSSVTEDRNETAQYSSFAIQSDGTLGYLFEEYPQPIFIVEPTNDPMGEYLMHSCYMNLRIGDIIEGMTSHAPFTLNPPVITPQTQTYDYNTVKTLPEVTVAQSNILPDDVGDVVTTHVVFRIYDNNGQLTRTIEKSFTGETNTFTNSELGIGPDDFGDNYRVQVNAYCAASDVTSTNDTENYHFKASEMRQIVVFAKPTAGWANPTVSAPGLGVKQQGEVLQVSVGTRVTVNAPAINPYKFVGYDLVGGQSWDEANSNQHIFATGNGSLNATKVNDLGYQIEFTVPSLLSQAYNNYDSDGDGEADAIALYAWFNAPANGIKSRVHISFYNSNHNVDHERNWFEYYSEFCQDASQCGQDFPTGNTSQLDFGLVSETENVPQFISQWSEASPANGVMPYPTGTDENNHALKVAGGLHFNAWLMPDAKLVKDFNCVVMLRKKVKGGDYSYLTRGEFNRPIVSNGRNMAAPWTDGVTTQPDETVPAYYLINGSNYRFPSDGAVAVNALSQADWFDEEQNPTVVKDLVFNNLIDGSTIDMNDVNTYYGEDNSPYVVVDVFVVSKNSLSSVQELADGHGYVYRVSHYFQPDASGIITGVARVASDNNVNIVGLTGGAMIETATPTDVTICNMRGQVVAHLAKCRGSRFVNLPAGVYVACGRKFMVK